MIDTEAYRILPGQRPGLAGRDTDVSGGLDKDAAREEFRRLRRRLVDLQALMYAEGRHALLVVLQAMDAAGKDSTIRSVFGPVNPQGCRVTGFKAPTRHELAHDYLWRVHREVPARGYIRVFNRSHYEDVLVVRVLGLVPEARWRARYAQLRDFERLLGEEGTQVVKFFLHVSRDYQKERFARRLARPDKHWKFNPKDLEARARWDDYMAAYEDALGECSTDAAPWYAVPAEKRWFRDLLITRVLVDRLEGLDMRFPEPDFDPAAIVLD